MLIQLAIGQTFVLDEFGRLIEDPASGRAVSVANKDNWIFLSLFFSFCMLFTEVFNRLI